MSNIFIKTPVSQKPEKEGYYFCICKGGNHVVFFNKEKQIWGRGRSNETNWADIILYWLSEPVQHSGELTGPTIIQWLDKTRYLERGQENGRESFLEGIGLAKSYYDPILARMEQVQGEFAVGFVEWMANNKWIKYGAKTGMWYRNGSAEVTPLSTSELISLYKSKTENHG